MILVHSNRQHPQQAGQGALQKSPICVRRQMAAGEDVNTLVKGALQIQLLAIERLPTQMAGSPKRAVA